ncbi:hypothetical protein JRO89_XS04G0101000 [Xanthoceras sorbifolium]|uniref:CID domain-containing protein n=1 Tax=Xanthoceras sorbifolium TaxID=99658 RepID=A0ABQ8I4X6_9ROSI|nr:hypothetical protein JRO89_XS04G0101000 [Xanthoceras sorbifolium]
MSNDAFDGQILADKLSKLNNSQQSIELIGIALLVEQRTEDPVIIWSNLVSFVEEVTYLLRKGSEFVNEFWKVLPGALKHVYDNGDEYGKKAVTRLVNIWEERKVFGSRGQNLKDEMLGKNPRPISVNNGKSSNPIKIVKRDANCLRIKLAVGGSPEKIITAFQSVLDEHLNEETALNNCNAAVHHVCKLGEDVENAPAQGNQHVSALLDQLQEQENVLQQCIGQLENAETMRATLVFQLKEALQDQELNLELICAQLQVARDQIKRASDMRKRLTLQSVPGLLTGSTAPVTETTRVVEPIFPSIQPTSTPAPQPPLNQPVVSFAPLKTTEEENKRAAAAAVAAKLAASTSSAQMLTSVLSSLVAEEAASMNSGSNSGGFSAGLSIFPLEKRPKLDKPMAISDVSNSDVGSSPYYSPLQQQQMTNMPVASSTNMQPVSQLNQSSGMMVGVMPYGYGANTLPPPPPLPPHIAVGLGRPASQILSATRHWFLWAKPALHTTSSPAVTALERSELGFSDKALANITPNLAFSLKTVKARGSSMSCGNMGLHPESVAIPKVDFNTVSS